MPRVAAVPPVAVVPRVAVVVVTYNSRQHLAGLCASLRAQTYPAIDLVVVDSNSADDTLVWLRGHWPSAHVVASTRNLGYRRGNQVGMECAWKHLASVAQPQTPEDYMLVLNDDVELHPRAIEHMVSAAEASPRVGMVAPAILLYTSAHRLNAAGSSLLPSGFYAARGKDRDYRQYCQRREIAAASGCCFLYRASVYREVGGFDAVFDSLPGGWHASAEDLDLSWRVWRAGYTVLYQPDAVLWHKYEQRPLHQARFASLVAGRLAFLAMNFPGWQLLWFAPLLLLTEAMLGAYSLVRGIVFLRAWLDGYRWLWGNRRRLRELRGTRAARYHATSKRLLGLLQPAIRLAPAVERNPLLWLASQLWFAVNALTLGAARLTASTAEGHPQ